MASRRSKGKEPAKKPSDTTSRRSELMQLLMEDDERIYRKIEHVAKPEMKPSEREDKAREISLNEQYAKAKAQEQTTIGGKSLLHENQFIVSLPEKKKKALYMEGYHLLRDEEQAEKFHQLNEVLESIKYSWLNLPVDPKDVTEFPDKCINCGNVFNGKAELVHFLHRLGFDYQVIFNRLGVVGTHDFFPCCRNELMNILPKSAADLDYDLIRGFKDLTVAEQEARERFRYNPNYTYAMKIEDDKRRKQEEDLRDDPNGLEYIDVGCGLYAPVIKGNSLQTK
jgi:hypothetical protein